MILSLTIRVKTSQPENVAKVISVDNVNIPKGMSIKVSAGKDEVIIEIVMSITRASDILTVKNTADDILRQIDVIERTLNKVG